MHANVKKIRFLKQFHQRKKVKVQEQTFRELFLRQLYLLHTKIKICLHL